MDFTLYWFMLPVSMGVATTAMLSGIGGAALFTLRLVIGFHLFLGEGAVAILIRIGEKLLMAGSHFVFRHPAVAIGVELVEHLIPVAVTGLRAEGHQAQSEACGGSNE